MALKFSQVMVLAEGKLCVFLMGGFPFALPELMGWGAYEDFVKVLNNPVPSMVHADVYITGEDEDGIQNADVEDIKEIYRLWAEDPDFLEEECRKQSEIQMIIRKQSGES